jgi:hypothetical protein
VKSLLIEKTHKEKGIIQMTYEEFLEMKQRVGWGEEFLIYYKDKGFWISRNSEGAYFARNDDGYTQEFKNSDELFENAKIEDIYLKDLREDIEW